MNYTTYNYANLLDYLFTFDPINNGELSKRFIEFNNTYVHFKDDIISLSTEEGKKMFISQYSSYVDENLGKKIKIYPKIEYITTQIDDALKIFTCIDENMINKDKNIKKSVTKEIAKRLFFVFNF
jgi:hypothetical protein